VSTEHDISDRIKSITYYGGRFRGRCYDFVDKATGHKVTMTETDLLALINDPTSLAKRVATLEHDQAVLVRTIGRLTGRNT
jgi:hypothetical protein